MKADAGFGTYFTACSTAADVADAISTNSSVTGLPEAVAKIARQNITGTGTALVAGNNTLDDGYYLIVDSGPVGEGQAYNAALLQVVGDITINVKTDAPTVEKKVLEDDKYYFNDGYGEGFNDVADYSIGEEITFRLIGSVPDMSYYDVYDYIFHDTLSEGLTLDPSSISVYLSNEKQETSNDPMTPPAFEYTLSDATDYYVNLTSSDPADPTAVDGFYLTMSSQGLTIASGYNYIIVEYKATLNENAEIGLPGNPNTVFLEYSNNPDSAYETGTTPVDQVVVFTYGLGVLKRDIDDNKLEGAEFVLLNETRDKVAILNNNTRFIEWQDLTDDPDNITNWPAGSVIGTTAPDGNFTIWGLDDGTYYLKETEAPSMYNLLTADVKVVIDAETVNGQTYTGYPEAVLTDINVTADDVPGTSDLDTGAATITILNNRGSTLPETGGVGRTIFYIVGSLLVVGAAILLIAKRRTGYNEEELS